MVADGRLSRLLRTSQFRNPRPRERFQYRLACRQIQHLQATQSRTNQRSNDDYAANQWRHCNDYILCKGVHQSNAIFAATTRVGLQFYGLTSSLLIRLQRHKWNGNVFRGTSRGESARSRNTLEDALTTVLEVTASD